MRRDIGGWDVRWDPVRAEAARACGAWDDRTIADHAVDLLRADPDRVLVIDGLRSLTVRMLWEEAERLAHALLRRGMRPGDTLSFQIPNWHEAMVIALAAAMAGLVINPITPIYRDREVAFMLADSRSRCIFIPGTFRKFDYPAMLRRLLPAMENPPQVVTVRAEPGGFLDYAALCAEPAGREPLPGADPDAVKVILYTSGTTGRAKGVLHSHNSLQAENWARRTHLGLGGRDRLFNPSPVTHVTGLLYALTLPFTTGVPTVLLDLWDAPTALDLMRDHAVTGMVASTIFLEELLAEARRRGERLPHLRFFLCGGAQVRPELIREASAQFPNCAITRIYGATEVPCVTGGRATRQPFEWCAETDGEIQGCEACVLDPRTGESLAPESEGEIAARGPQMLLGYTRPEDGDGAFTADGYFRMGDLGRIVGGHVVVTGRIKDLIIRAGENISPKEIEDLLAGHPAVADVAVVAMPDPRTGEAGCAFIAPRAGESIDLAEVRRFLVAAGTAMQKIPERVVLVDEMPRTSIGKIRKDVLRARARELGEAPVAG